MQVNVSTARLRRCFDNTYTVEYGNIGTVDASDVHVDLGLDPYMQMVSCDKPWTVLGDDSIRVTMGAVDKFDFGRFNFVVNLDCDSTLLGQTHCVEAHIYHDTFCTPLDLRWSGASIEANIECDDDSVRVRLRNVGDAQSQELEWIIVEDDIGFMRRKASFAPQEMREYAIASHGETWRVLAEQEPYHPGNSHPTKAIEGCNSAQGTFSLGYYTNFSEDDENPFIDIDCQRNVGAFDPNDKLGYPDGVGLENQIEPDQRVTYTIRFQNTGTDTAFNVVVKDSLHAELDRSTFKLIGSSHDVFVDGGDGDIISFYFNNIMLPDSHVNQEASNGFVKYEIELTDQVQRGDVVLNNADIYFDFNLPIRTNQTRHTVAPMVVSMTHDRNSLHVPSIAVYPNPAHENFVIDWSEIEVEPGVDLEVVNLQGHVVFRAFVHNAGQKVKVNPDNWASGRYGEEPKTINSAHGKARLGFLLIKTVCHPDLEYALLHVDMPWEWPHALWASAG